GAGDDVVTARTATCPHRTADLLLDGPRLDSLVGRAVRVDRLRHKPGLSTTAALRAPDGRVLGWVQAATEDHLPKVRNAVRRGAGPAGGGRRPGPQPRPRRTGGAALQPAAEAGAPHDRPLRRPPGAQSPGHPGPLAGPLAAGPGRRRCAGRRAVAGSRDGAFRPAARLALGGAA